MSIVDSQTEQFRYVRVQDDLHGMTVDGSGSLVLACSPNATRNTMHFAINGIVEDHAYGRFNFHRDGSLKGKIVVIANPAEMGVPAGFNQVDTWFRMGAKVNDDGTLTRQLNAGHANVVVPVGTKVPAGMNAVFYDGSVEGRDTAVAKTLAEQNVVQHVVGFRAWADSNEADAPKWARDTAQQIYGDNFAYIHIGMHDTSPDGNMDSVGIGNWVDQFQQAGTTMFVDDNGISRDYISAMEVRKRAHSDLTGHFVSELSSQERERCGKFYDALATKLERDMSRAHEVQAVAVTKEDVRREKFIAIEEALLGLTPSGEIYMANATAPAGMEKLRVHDFVYRLLDAEVNANTQVWIQGRTIDWQPIASSPLRDVFFEAQGNTPSGIMPPPLPVEPTMAQQANNAMLALSTAIKNNQAVNVLGELLDAAVKKTAMSCQESQTSPSEQTVRSLSHFGSTIKSIALLDGDMATLSNVESLMSKAEHEWKTIQPKQELAFSF